jgi:hypothetical protein
MLDLARLEFKNLGARKHMIIGRRAFSLRIVRYALPPGAPPPREWRDYFRMRQRHFGGTVMGVAGAPCAAT